MFNEGVDIPAVNQIVMLRSTESSIIFTQQLGRGLRKFPYKDSVVVIDFIGNYNNNYLIPVALYGNTGDRDRARKNLQRKSIGLSSISFDPIAKERVLKSLDTANWSEMKKLSEQYRQVRYELGRIPMLMDIYAYDPSLPYTLATKRSNYLDFVRSREKSLGGGKNHETTFEDQLDPVTDTEDAVLKMATELLLPGCALMSWPSSNGCVGLPKSAWMTRLLSAGTHPRQSVEMRCLMRSVRTSHRLISRMRSSTPLSACLTTHTSPDRIANVSGTCHWWRRWPTMIRANRPIV